ncbi:response regulator transcription factor [Jeongeupia sp. USM3]|uniref:response regulator transcription factor n=1 Tax=Jeongeupia sp. USM3 TaxID=1906741 RepID=UPI00089DD84F|nr:response regulator transcription factor [Jeongeupia sp. USM3]AOX99058.1 DNA-binding response regulator [Jeongeupia sp. USM3]
MIRIIVADDHPIVLAGISREIVQYPGFELVGEASNSTELMQLLDGGVCDVLVTDYSMPGGKFGDGLPMLQLLRRRFPDLRIVVMTMLDNPALIRNMQKAGMNAILNKSDKVSHVAAAISAVHLGGDYLPLSVRHLLQAAVPDLVEQRLSKRELEVLRQCASGMAIVEIARLANRSTKTISTQKTVAMRKLGLENDHDIFQYAVSTGLISPAC